MNDHRESCAGSGSNTLPVDVCMADEDLLSRLGMAVEQTREAVVVTDEVGTIIYVNPAFEAVSGYTREEAVGANPSVLKSGEHDEAFYRELWGTIRDGRTWSGRFVNRRKDGTIYHEDGTISPILDACGRITGFVAVKRDVTERLHLETRLVQAQKLEAVGQLAAGIAHEINTPTQYIGDNTRFLEEAFGDLVPLLHKIARLLEAARGGSVSEDSIADLAAAWEEADLDFLVAEIPRAIRESLEGNERISRIVRAMKDFSHPGVEGRTSIDLNGAIESTITVARGQWDLVADVETDFDAELPWVQCMPGELNQVFLNVLVNAAHAIADVVECGPVDKGTIRVSTRRDGDWAEIRVADTGTGIPDEHRGRIFDPFFTTKDVGKGTGQGLAISYDIVVRKHSGTISFDTELGAGTTFLIRIPLSTPSRIGREDGA